MRRIAYPVLRNGIVTTDGECYATKPNITEWNLQHRT